MSRIMTIDEIYDQFDSEWVLVKDPQTNDDLEVLSGEVVAHSASREDVYHAAIALPKGSRSAVVYTGTIPEDAAVIL